MDDAKRPTALVLAPFRGSWATVRDSVDETFDARGVNAIWLDVEAELGSSSAASVREYVDGADFVIADLTDANPNVMYEMGFAHALRKPVLPIIDSRLESVPSPLRGRFVFVFNRTKPEELITFLGRWMERYLVESRIEEVVG